MIKIKVTKEEKQELLNRFDVNNAERVFKDAYISPYDYVYTIEIACVLCQKYTCLECPVTLAYEAANEQLPSQACSHWLFQAWLETEPEDPTLFDRLILGESFINYIGEEGKLVVETLRSQLDKYLVVE